MPTCFTQWESLAALTDEETAYHTLIQRFEHPIFNLVSWLVDDPSDAADVVQEVFLKVFRNSGAFRGEGTMKKWIYRIAVNEARHRRRWFRRHRRQEVGLDREPGAPYGYGDSRPEPTLIEEALSKINPKLRAALVLREIEGLSHEEISEILDVSLGTVKSRILRGRDVLRRHLAARGEGICFHAAIKTL